VGAELFDKDWVVIAARERRQQHSLGNEKSASV